MLLTHQVCVPHAHNVAHTQLPHKQAIHPPKSKLHVLDTLLLQMAVKRSWRGKGTASAVGVEGNSTVPGEFHKRLTIDPAYQLAHPPHLPLDAWLCKDVVVLDAIE